MLGAVVPSPSMVGEPAAPTSASVVARVESLSATGLEPEVSVVVSTYGRCGFLADLVEALEAQDLPRAAFEVVVVDNGSGDETWSLLEARAAQTPLRFVAVRLEANCGAGGGRNAGLLQARAPIVAFTDDDCIPAPNWLSALHATRTLGDPDKVVVQGKTVPWPDDAAGAGPWDRTVWVLRPTWLFETCNISYGRAALMEAGGFPSEGHAPSGAKGRAFGEDALAGWAVVGSGAELYFADDAVVYHRHLAATYRQWLEEQRGKGGFPALVATDPRVRTALWSRYFLAPRTAMFDVAVLGLVAACVSGRARWLTLGAVWAAMALGEARERGGGPLPLRLAQLAAGDAVGAWSLASSSARHRRLVL